MWHDFCRHIASFEVGPNPSLPQYLDTYDLKTPFLHGHVIHVLKDVITYVVGCTKELTRGTY